jgi:Family of unknown function (DUF5995)
MYLRTNERSATIGKAPAPPRLHPRCRSLVLTVPDSYAALEEAVRRWISTCVMSRTEVRPGVPIRRERELVTGNPSLRSIWDRILQHMKGQRVEIVAEYVWGPDRVESINFSTPTPPPPPRRRCLPVAEAPRIEREAAKKTLHKAAEVARRFVTTVGAVGARGRFIPTVLDNKYWFAKLYELTTYYEIDAEKRFRHPAFVFHFIPVFHGMYVDALENFERGNFSAVHPLWLRHFRTAGRPDVSSLMAGVQNSIVTATAAHIQGDMATALVRAYRSHVARYCLRNPPFETFRADFENMQPIFARSQAAFFLELSLKLGFSPEVGQLIIGIGARYAGGLDLDEVLRWRAAAWSEAARRLP